MKGASPPKIVPRVVLELAPQQHLELLTDGREAAVKLLAREARRQGFDGLVRPAWLRLSPAANHTRATSCNL